MDQTKFVILSGPRTGSTYLVDYLNAVPETRCCSELFRNDRVDFRHHPPADPRLHDPAFRDAQPGTFIALVAEQARDCRRFGFKMIGTQFAKHGADFLRQVFVGRGWKKIFLWRDDVVEQSVSYALAARHFGEEVWGRTPDRLRITLSPKELLNYLHSVQTTYFIIEAALANSASDDVFALEYGDLGKPSVMAGLLRFLDVPETVVDQTIARTHEAGLDFAPGPKLAERVENYAELRRFFRDSRYRRYVA